MPTPGGGQDSEKRGHPCVAGWNTVVQPLRKSLEVSSQTTQVATVPLGNSAPGQYPETSPVSPQRGPSSAAVLAPAMARGLEQRISSNIEAGHPKCPGGMNPAGGLPCLSPGSHGHPSAHAHHITPPPPLPVRILPFLSMSPSAPPSEGAQGGVGPAGDRDARCPQVPH